MICNNLVQIEYPYSSKSRDLTCGIDLFNFTPSVGSGLNYLPLRPGARQGVWIRLGTCARCSGLREGEGERKGKRGILKESVNELNSELDGGMGTQMGEGVFGSPPASPLHVFSIQSSSSSS